MLIANKSKIAIEIDLNLIFDDDTAKSFRIKEGDIIAITYRYHFKKLQKVGMVRKIEYIAAPKNSDMEPSAVLIMDFSRKHNSIQGKIRLDDILNVEQVSIPEDKPEIDYDDLGIKIFGGI